MKQTTEERAAGELNLGLAKKLVASKRHQLPPQMQEQAVAEIERLRAARHCPTGGEGLREAATYLLGQFEQYLGSDLNHECAHRYLAEDYKPWEALRVALAALSTAPQADEPHPLCVKLKQEMDEFASQGSDQARADAALSKGSSR